MVKFGNINLKGNIMKSIYMATGAGGGKQKPRESAQKPPVKPKK